MPPRHLLGGYTAAYGGELVNWIGLMAHLCLLFHVMPVKNLKIILHGRPKRGIIPILTLNLVSTMV